MNDASESTQSGLGSKVGVKRSSGGVVNCGENTVVPGTHVIGCDSYDFSVYGLSQGPYIVKKILAQKSDVTVTGVSPDRFIHLHIHADPVPADEWSLLKKVCVDLRELMWKKFQAKCASDTNNLPATKVTNVSYLEAVWGCERVSLVCLHFCLFPQIKGNLEH